MPHAWSQTPFVLDSLAHISSVDYYNYPLPEKRPNRLFFVQRNVSKNVVVYETNFNEDGSIDQKRPLKMFWKRYNNGQNGVVVDLKWYEKKWIYDIKVHSRGTDGLNLCLTSYKDLTFKLVKTPDGTTEAQTRIKDRMTKLEYVFVHEKKGLVMPEVLYLELGGKDIETGELIFERYIP